MSATKQQAGSLGGLETARKYGAGHMADIGRRGAAATWARYNLVPVGASGWAMVDRKSGEVKAVTGYHPMKAR